MGSELVSVIIPTFNSEKHIDSALLSLENQTYKNIEVLVIDDCSSDNTYNLLCERTREHTYHFPLKVLKMDINLGHGNARNCGMAAMSGKYVMFLDSDDTLENEAISTLVTEMKDEVDICMCSFYRKRGNRKQTSIFSVKEGLFTSKELLSEVLTAWPLNWFSCVGTKLYRTETIKRSNVRFDDVNYKYNEDLGFVVDYMRVCSNVKVIKDELYCYTYTPGSVQHKKKYRTNSVYTIRNSRMNFKKLLDENSLYEEKKDLFLSTLVNAYFIMFLSQWDSYKDFLELFKVIAQFPEIKEMRKDMATGTMQRIFVSNLIHNKPKSEYILFKLLNEIKVIKALIADR